MVSQRTGILQCGAGYTLQEVQDYARNYSHRNTHSEEKSMNFTVPIDIGSKGTCTMGGIVATNAGGQYYYRYQSLLANVIGLQCVTGTGTILQWNYPGSNSSTTTNVNLKDNTGYKLYPLLIGSEGTLGIVTGVTLKCTPQLPNRQTMMVTILSSNLPAHPNLDDDHRDQYNHDDKNDHIHARMMKYILQIVQLAQGQFGEILAAVEWMDPNILQVIRTSMDDHDDMTKITKFHQLLSLSPLVNSTSLSSSSSHSTTSTTNDLDPALSSVYPHCLLIETHGTNPRHDEEKCYDFLNAMMDLNTNHATTDEKVPFVVDVKMAKHDTDSQYFWSIRESANPSVTRLGYTYKYDVSIPNSYFDLLIQPMKDRIYEKYSSDRIVITNWGHILDGNLHLNITDVGNHARDAELVSILEPFIYEQVIRLGGSISAEHGIGQMKTKYMQQIHDPTTLQMMHAIKKNVFDPAGIMNPGKVLPPLPELQ